MKQAKILRLLSQALVFAVFSSVWLLPGIGFAQTESDSWINGDIQVVGRGIKSDLSDKSVSNKNLKAVAMEDARKKLGKEITGIRITANETLNADLANSIAKLSVYFKEKSDADGNIKVIVKLFIYGEKSLMNAVLKPYDKIPAPMVTDEKSIAQGGYTSIVIDCTSWEDQNKVLLNPVLIPEIKDDAGRSVYNYKNIDYDTAVKKGCVRYASDLKSAKAGQNPLVIRITNLADELGTPVISAKDAKKILLENGASHFLDNGNVIILTHRVDIVIQNNRGWEANESENAGNNIWAGMG